MFKNKCTINLYVTAFFTHIGISKRVQWQLFTTKEQIVIFIKSIKYLMNEFKKAFKLYFNQPKPDMNPLTLLRG